MDHCHGALYGPWTHEPPLRYRNGQGLSVTRTCANDTSAILLTCHARPQPSLASLATLASLASLASLATLTIRFARSARLIAQTPVHTPERLARRLTSSVHTCLQHTPAARSLCSTPHQQLPHLRFARFACLLAQTPVGSARARALRSPSDEQHAHLLATHACSTYTCSLPHQQLPHLARFARLLHRSLRLPAAPLASLAYLSVQLVHLVALPAAHFARHCSPAARFVRLLLVSLDSPACLAGREPGDAASADQHVPAGKTAARARNPYWTIFVTGCCAPLYSIPIV